MLDGYLAYARSGTWGNSEKYICTDYEEYAALNPEMYLFGHGHGDHMGHAPQILQLLPTLQMYGMAEHCNDIKARMAPALSIAPPSWRLARRLEPRRRFPPT
jgi:hypothetical protein